MAGLVRHVRLMVRALGLAVRRRREVPEDGAAIPYGGPLRPMMWVFTALTPLEVVLVELAVPWPPVRVVLTALGVLSTLWFLALIATMSTYPHSVDPRVLRLRYCSFTDLRVPVAEIDGVRTIRRDHDATSSGRVVEGTLVLDVMSSTNVAVTLRGDHEVGPGLLARAVDFWADDPDRAARLIRAELRG
ncbi:hypothetical protein [Actinophytocola xanthii]|uniref:DUF304 domain-containing protein n=1 Tax=Actinophytocola xanthii TaxID=1912961 RepID=A0A1Q8CKS3_9PSEU|nr:hypothetical protein [Actinophytocola xanthii]OLF14942.1 hypothetical protein BU204_24720 [Actinophytocola xanthii]